MTTGIIEIDSLIDESRDEANREIGRLIARNEALTAELKRALDKISRLEKQDEQTAIYVIESNWDGVSPLPETVESERPDAVVVECRGKTIKAHAYRIKYELTEVPY
jgi:hypothetical protein